MLQLRRLVSAASIRPLLSNGWPQQSSASELGIDDVESGLAEQPLGHVRQRFGVVAALRAHRARGAARKVDDPLDSVARGCDSGGLKCAARGNAGDHLGTLPPEKRRIAVERALHRPWTNQPVQQVGHAQAPRERRR